MVGVGLAGGALFALWVAVALMPSGMDLGNRSLAWVTVIGGPVVGTTWGMAEHHPVIGFGWLGFLMAFAHPVRPHWVTGVVTVAGLVAWLFAGFVTVIVAVWGA